MFYLYVFKESVFMIKKYKIFFTLTVPLILACGEETDDRNEQVSESEATTEQVQESSSSETSSTSESESSASDTETAAITNISVSLEDAVKQFKEHFDIAGEIENEYELKFDANSGDVLDEETENDDEADEAIALADVILPENAMNIAKAEIGSEAIEACELDVDDVTHYIIDFADSDTEVEVNAMTGNIIEIDD